MHSREVNDSMPMSWRWMPVVIAVWIFATIGINTAGGKSLPTPVEVWCSGDDGLTIRLRDAIESAFESSAVFRLNKSKKPRALVVTIPSNVEWEQVGQRNRVLYTVKFGSPD